MTVSSQQPSVNLRYETTVYGLEIALERKPGIASRDISSFSLFRAQFPSSSLDLKGSIILEAKPSKSGGDLFPQSSPQKIDQL